MSLIKLLLARFGDSLWAPFGPAQLAIVLVLLGGYGLVAIPQGLASGLLRTPWRRLTAPSWLRLAASLMVMPSLLEEGFFRVLLLPRGLVGLAPLEQLAWAGLSVGLFVLYHPLAGRLWYPQGRPLFEQARFLVPCGLLGAACVIAYASTGSLWAPALIHWFTVLIWLGPADGGRDLTERGVQG